uniref:Uncharacterized protein n=2 Tax=Phaeomonas parva TaxID=124430 RepID=A0A7S1XME5_9STRA|mmetsp:Transcript_16669/g.51191  ORF Transcript_16669/g.51191 Transcript_16669/m.51191 type:complete len:270 (+) Transcript_16669:116-925(+)
MAALTLATTATYVKHESCEATTNDFEDHTFCGIMFDLEVRTERPVDFIEIESLWVRGYLGPITVWATRGGIEGKHEEAEHWTKLYEKQHNPSMRRLVELKLDFPLLCRPGERFGLYVHSKRNDDMAIVYDNVRSVVTHEDPFIRMLPGLAHLSPVPFSSWEGAWWGCWRERRCFVGKCNFGVRYLLWTPRNQVNPRFPQCFRRSATALFHTHAFSWKGLPAEVVLYILNMCPWDWFGAEGLDSESMMARAMHQATTGVRNMMPWSRLRG